MLYLLLFSYFMSPPGEVAAMEAYAAGELSLVYIGELPPEGYRDSATGILLESLGCEYDPDTEQFMEDWNGFTMNVWRYLGSDSTFFVIKTDLESLEYRNMSLVYRDQWGSVPIDIRPENIAAVVSLVCRTDTVVDSMSVRLEVYTPLQGDTLSAYVSSDATVIADLLARGRIEIQRNAVSP